MAAISALITGRRTILLDYLSAISGSAGRLVFSLLYFVVLANALSIEEFGLFATASSAGVMLSRILGFGFISALYRVATVKPRLLGLFAGGFLAMAALSLPFLGAAAWLVHALFFGADMVFPAFAVVIAAEALLWRPAEAIVIVNNGLNRFGRAAVLVIFGTLARAAAALAFALWARGGLEAWVFFYLAANAVSLAVGLLFFMPRQRLRFRFALYWRRLADSVYVAGAELLFYLQMDMDKLLVLAIGGPRLAGIYAIIMRLVDLTAIPIRTFSMMLVQKLMRAPGMLRATATRAGIEAAVMTASTVALLALAVLLHFFPSVLGRNVAEAAPLLGLALLVPGLRNLVEYQAELLFARGQTLIRAANLALLTLVKALLLSAVLAATQDTAGVILMLNPLFLALYVLSALLTYAAMRRPAKRF